jgi:hypothetical protein
MSARFNFEAQNDDFEGIPLTFRFKLDLLGVELSPEAWRRLPLPERRALMRRPVRTRGEQGSLQVFLQEALRRQGADLRPADPERLARERRAWGDLRRVPEEVEARAQACGVPVLLRDWANLDDVERYGLYRLAVEPGERRDCAAAYHELVHLAWGTVFA